LRFFCPRTAADEGSAILEVRAGTGGDEAALFAGDLFRMYVKYAERKRWKVEVLSTARARLAGLRKSWPKSRAAASFARFKFESGVHRVQRVAGDRDPGTHSHFGRDRRRALPIAQESDFEINEADLKIEHHALRAAPAASTSTRPNRRSRITHLPTGVVVAMQEERSQHRNRANAMAILRSRILDAKNQAAR